MTKKIAPVQVEELEQLSDEEEGEQVKFRELAQQIEQMVEATDMKLEQEPQDQGIEVMLRTS